MRRWLILLALAGCADSAPPPSITGSVPPPPPSRFDGSYRGTATRVFGTDFNCGRPSNALTMVIAQGRAVGRLPGQDEGRGTVAASGSLTLRGNLDASQRAEGRISDSFEFTASFQSRFCRWDMRLNREG